METLEAAIERVVSGLLPSKPLKFDKAKFVNDPIHGTIVVKPYEQSIIDTPLFQRLRHIRQTGFTFLVFPTAQHTRFEHSLGVMTIASRILDVLREKYNVDKLSCLRVRLAALMHDLGHSAFSHTTEEFYSFLPDMVTFKESHEAYLGKGAGEIMSRLIINSKAFARFYEQLSELYPNEGLEEISLEDVSNLVTGEPRGPELAYEADIVSGPIDADKLDYFPRDGRAVGIDVSIDIHRLIQCMEVQDVPAYGPNPTRRSLVINRRGYNSLQQLLFARATLTATVYHHHKVRACDSMLKNLLQYHVDTSAPFMKIGLDGGLSLSQAANFLQMNDSDILARGGIGTGQSVDSKISEALFSRNLLKRVLKVSRATVQSQSETTELQHVEIDAALSAFNNLKKDIVQRQSLVEEVTRSFTGRMTKYEWALDFPHRASLDKAGMAPINTSSSSDTPRIVLLKSVIPISDWVKGYETHFGHAYVFGPADPVLRIELALAMGSALANRQQPLYLTYDAIAEDIRQQVMDKEKATGSNIFRS